VRDRATFPRDGNPRSTETIDVPKTASVVLFSISRIFLYFENFWSRNDARRFWHVDSLIRTRIPSRGKFISKHESRSPKTNIQLGFFHTSCGGYRRETVPGNQYTIGLFPYQSWRISSRDGEITDDLGEFFISKNTPNHREIGAGFHETNFAQARPNRTIRSRPIARSREKFRWNIFGAAKKSCGEKSVWSAVCVSRRHPSLSREGKVGKSLLYGASATSSKSAPMDQNMRAVRPRTDRSIGRRGLSDS
jgi:hypothetical protein